MENDLFRLAFICTGNRFRSPLAAAVATRALDGLPVSVESAGLLDARGAGPLDEAVFAGAAVGLDLSTHRCRRFAPGSLRRCDLVVGFERRHVTAAVSEGGAHVARVFTLPEAVESLEALRARPDAARDPVAAARVLVRRAHDRRTDGAASAGVREIPDPLGQPGALQRRIAATVEELTRRLALGLFEAAGRLTRP